MNLVSVLIKRRVFFSLSSFSFEVMFFVNNNATKMRYAYQPNLHLALRTNNNGISLHLFYLMEVAHKGKFIISKLKNARTELQMERKTACFCHLITFLHSN